MMVIMNVLGVATQTSHRRGENMRKADKENFYKCIDEVKYLIESNKVLSIKDISMIENEIVTIRYLLNEKYTTR